MTNTKQAEVQAPVIQLTVDGEVLDLRYIIGAYQVTGGAKDTGHSLVGGELNINDLCNAVVHVVRDVFTTLVEMTHDSETTFEVVTDAVSLGLAEAMGVSDSSVIKKDVKVEMTKVK